MVVVCPPSLASGTFLPLQQLIKGVWLESLLMSLVLIAICFSTHTFRYIVPADHNIQVAGVKFGCMQILLLFVIPTCIYFTQCVGVSKASLNVYLAKTTKPLCNYQLGQLYSLLKLTHTLIHSLVMQTEPQSVCDYL